VIDEFFGDVEDILTATQELIKIWMPASVRREQSGE